MKLIQTKDYLLLIDEEAEIKDYNIVYNYDLNVVWEMHPHGLPTKNPKTVKCIAYYPLTKEVEELDLPLLPNPFENIFDLKKEIVNWYHSKSGTTIMHDPFLNEIVDKSQSKQFSLEDIEKALEHGWFQGKEHGIRFGTQIEGEDRRKDIKQYLQSLSTQQLPKEFIMVKVDTNAPVQQYKSIMKSGGKHELVGTYKY